MNAPKRVAGMVDCDQAAVIARGAAVACTLHQFDLNTAAVKAAYPVGLAVPPVGAICGQHLRAPESYAAIMRRFRVVVRRLPEVPRVRATDAEIAELRRDVAEATALLQSLLGAAEDARDAAAAAVGVDAFDQFLNDLGGTQ